ncbi:MAG: hypothetical protein RMJ44_02160 [Cytophagales bacterium]|nr:hypothetical protein [Bernardetiaceae bacterium]MDW8209864.1 hypothetical protein [Cytophagales bacterium]
MLFLDSLVTLNLARLNLNQQGMMLLGSWAVLNLVVGWWRSCRNQGQSRYFWQMNAYWNVINFFLAIAGYWNALQTSVSLMSLQESIIAQYRIEKIYLFNAALDVAYVVGGFYLMERARRNPSHAPRWQGFGKAIILQGTWLMIFDWVMWWLQTDITAQIVAKINRAL